MAEVTQIEVARAASKEWCQVKTTSEINMYNKCGTGAGGWGASGSYCKRRQEQNGKLN
jgi:hypothetical protein